MGENTKKRYASQKYVNDRTPDWNQNDPNGVGYIKNRPFYSYFENTEVVNIEETSIEFVEDSIYEGAAYYDMSLTKMLVEGQTYKVNFDGTEYECLARNDGYDEIYIGNQSIVAGDWEFPETIESNEPFFIASYDDEDDSWSCIAIPESELGIHNVSITAIEVQEKQVKIDSKYLPDNIDLDWNNLKNRPFGLIPATETILLEETSVYTGPDGVDLPVSSPLMFEVGKTYKVNFDGTQYECVAYAFSGVVAIGSTQIIGAPEFGDNVPFLCVSGYNALHTAEEDTHTISISTIEEEKIIKLDSMYLSDEISDWNYLKNKPFYDIIESSDTITFEETSVSFEDYQYRSDVIPKSSLLVEGQTYVVTFNGTRYECLARNSNYGSIYIGNQSLSGVPDGYFSETIESNEPFCIVTYYDGENDDSFESLFSVSELGTHTVSIAVVEQQVTGVVKLDSKYLPDDIAPDWNNLKNKPFGEPIDAPGYTEVQLLEEVSAYASPSSHYQVPASLTFENGKTYVVYFDGIRYECVAYEMYDQIVLGEGTVMNGGNVNGNNEPFLYVGYYNYLYAAEGDTHTISIFDLQLSEREELTKLDKMFLPEGIELKETKKLENAYEFKVDGDVVANSNSENPISLVELNNRVTLTGFVLEDIDNGLHYLIQMKSGRLVSRIACKELVITTLPDKINYAEGEAFDPTGMVVTAVYYDGTTKEVTDYKYSDIINNKVAITYVDSYEITVVLDLTAIQLVDFNYTENDDGTVTLTGWKGTLNGEPSTRCVVPDNSSIIIETDNFVELPNS